MGEAGRLRKLAPGAGEEVGEAIPPEVMFEKGLSPWTPLGVRSAELSHTPPPKVSQSPRPLGGAEGGTLVLDKGVAKTQRAKGGAASQKWGLAAPE